MKKIIAAMLCALLALGAGCTNAGSRETAEPSATPAAPEATAAAMAATPAPTPSAAPAPTTAPAPPPTPLPTPLPTPTPAPSMYSVESYPRVDGSTATIPLAAAVMAKACGIAPADAEVYCQHSKTAEAYNNLVNGDVDMLLVYAPPAEALAYAKQMGVELEMQPIGRDALVFLVNEGNPVTSLTREQIVSVYTGKTKDWSALGGAKGVVVPFQRDENSGSQTLFLKLVMGKTKPMKAPLERMPSEMGELIDQVASYRAQATAIGYSVYYYVKNMYEMPGIRLLGVDGVTPGNDTIRSGQYPYVNDFYAVVRKSEPQGTPARKLFDFMLSAEGQQIVADAGYVSIK